MKKSGASQGQSASELISKRIAELGDWRGKTLGRMRKLIQEADPDVVEEWKWMGTPVWSHDGIICTGESYKKVVKLTFAKGASLKDPARLFNSSLDGNVRRAIDIHEGEEVDASAFKALVRQAVALNGSARSKPPKKNSGLSDSELYQVTGSIHERSTRDHDVQARLAASRAPTSSRPTRTSTATCGGSRVFAGAASPMMGTAPITDIVAWDCAADGSAAPKASFDRDGGFPGSRQPSTTARCSSGSFPFCNT